MTSRPRQASVGGQRASVLTTSRVLAAKRERTAFSYVGLTGLATFVGWDLRPLRRYEASALPWRAVPVYRVKAPSRPMPAEAGA